VDLFDASEFHARRRRDEIEDNFFMFTLERGEDEKMKNIKNLLKNSESGRNEIAIAPNPP
jgi:hypothetical protein